MVKSPKSVSLGFALIVMLVSTGLAALGQSGEKDESERLIQATKFLEQKPFDKEAKDMRSWAIAWVIQTDKVTVTACPILISGLEEKYKYYSELFGQYTLGMAAFKLANADKAGDEAAVQLAGVESAMNSYESMVKEKPKAKNAFMDELHAKRTAGSLASYVAEKCPQKK
jgi:hypothetical protein